LLRCVTPHSGLNIGTAARNVIDIPLLDCGIPRLKPQWDDARSNPPGAPIESLAMANARIVAHAQVCVCSVVTHLPVTHE
jgi:hypothetical protein